MKPKGWIPVLMVLGTLLFTPFTLQAADVGKTCTTDADCGGGLCFDLSKITDVCKGKVCTIACTKNADCPPVAKEPQCLPGDGKKICQYGEWDKKYCQ